MKRIPVILAGGKGTRFWPLSREDQPKQCLPITGTDPMIQVTYERLKDFDEFAIIANQELTEFFQQLLPPEVEYIVEPIARNTAPAIGLAAAYLNHTFGDCIMFIETADHYYQDPTYYVEEIQDACSYAETHDKIVLIGIKPTHPHTGYGYIQRGHELQEGFYSVDQFKEKPDLETAEKYVTQGDFFWNSGMFIAKTSVLLKEIGTHIPSLSQILDTIRQSNFNPAVLEQEFPHAPKISIDYGVMEQSTNTVVKTSDMHWDDIGDLNAFARFLKPDAAQNYANMPIQYLDARENIVVGNQKKLVAMIGVENLIIVNTGDVLLVCDRNASQDVKKLREQVDPRFQ